MVSRLRLKRIHVQQAVTLLLRLWQGFLISNTNANVVCPNNITQLTVARESREYKIGCHSWHNDIIEYLNNLVGPTFDPPITFKRMSHGHWLRAPTPEEAVAKKDSILSRATHTVTPAMNQRARPLLWRRNE